MSRTVLATALFALGALSQAVNTSESTSACPGAGGAHFIVARASLEPVGYGIIGAVKNAVIEQFPASTAEFVQYPATLNDYENSETSGVVAMRALINQYIANCPTGPLVIMGYSQGAQVSLDSLAGQDDQAFPDNSTLDQPLPASTLARVAAVVVMGDPTFVTNETFHVGNATRNGDFPRTDLSGFAVSGLSSRIQSYCDADDLYCAGGKSILVHVSYVGEYGTQATNFVVKQLNAFGLKNGTTSSTNGTSSAIPRVSSASSASRVSAMPSRISALPSVSGRPSASATGAKNSTATASATRTPSMTASPSGVAVPNGASRFSGFAMAGVLGGLMALLL